MLPTGSQGFTVLETLIAALVVGIVAAAALPGFSSVLSAHRLSAAVSSTAGYVRLTRAIAVSQNRTARLRVDDEGKTLTIDVFRNSSWVAVRSPLVLDEGVVVETVSPAALSFTSQGLASSTTTITVGNSHGLARQIEVSPLGIVEVR